MKSDSLRNRFQEVLFKIAVPRVGVSIKDMYIPVSRVKMSITDFLVFCRKELFAAASLWVFICSTIDREQCVTLYSRSRIRVRWVIRMWLFLVYGLFSFLVSFEYERYNNNLLPENNHFYLIIENFKNSYVYDSRKKRP